MARLLQALLFLVITVGLVSRRVQAWGSPKIVRPFEDIPETYVYVQQALWYAMKEYNKASKDQYNFKVVNILKSQEQVGAVSAPNSLSLGLLLGTKISVRDSYYIGMETRPKDVPMVSSHWRILFVISLFPFQDPCYLKVKTQGLRRGLGKVRT